MDIELSGLRADILPVVWLLDNVQIKVGRPDKLPMHQEDGVPPDMLLRRRRHSKH